MKIWLVLYSGFGFKLDAVVIAESRGEAVAMLKLTPDCKLVGEPFSFGTADKDQKPRIVTKDQPLI